MLFVRSVIIKNVKFFIIKTKKKIFKKMDIQKIFKKKKKKKIFNKILN